jgi:peptidyl-prolyl cis-trans isomerase C
MLAILREPLVHFLLISAVLIAADRWRSPPTPADHAQIVVPDDIVESLADSWHKRTGAPPSTDEQQGLIDHYVEEEVLYREALRMGLEHGDLIVRRRLVQKMHYLLEDVLPPPPPTDAELTAWLQAHPDEYTRPEKIAIEHRYFSRDRHGPDTAARAEQALQVLRAGGADSGDPSMVAAEQPLRTQAQLTRDLGPAFAAEAFALSGDGWQGPVASSYGLHLVRVLKRQPARLLLLDEVRDDVVRDHKEAAERAQREAWIRELTGRYTVEVSLR